ncbi:hypothetical protein D3C71_869790 [compost metagenome]
MGVLRQGRVKINDVRHDGRTQHTRRQEYRFRRRQAWDNHSFTELHQIRLRENQLDDVSRRDKQQQTANHQLKRLLPAPLQHQNQESGNPGQHGALQERHAQDQLEADGRADKLRQVGRHRNDLCLHPIKPNHRTRIVIANLFCEIFPCRNAELCRQHLNEHRHEIGPHHDPQ